MLPRPRSRKVKKRFAKWHRTPCNGSIRPTQKPKVKILVAGSGNGKGLAVNNNTKDETFMKMLELQAGLGMGVKKFRVIFVFDNVKALNSFVNSDWDFSGQTTAAAKNGDKGAALAGAVSVSDGVWMYQLTDKGLAVEITAKGTKYYKDSDLN